MFVDTIRELFTRTPEPEGGHADGEVVATGTPEDIAACKASYTGRFLKAHFKG